MDALYLSCEGVCMCVYVCVHVCRCMCEGNKKEGTVRTLVYTTLLQCSFTQY